MDSDGEEFDMAARERNRLQRNARKQGFLSAVEDMKIEAAQAAYTEEFAAVLAAQRAKCAAECTAALNSATSTSTS